MFSGKPNPAADTLKANKDLKLLHSPCESRDRFVFHAVDTPPKVLQLQHILKMYDYLVGRSPSYVVHKTNCRWLCFGIFECLRSCQPCYGGHWMGSKTHTSWNDDEGAGEAKNHYLKEMHSACCFSGDRPVSIFQALVAESSGTASAIVRPMANNMINNRKFCEVHMYPFSQLTPNSRLKFRV